MKFNQIIVLVCCASVVISGCAGRASNPIMACQPGDNEKSCSSISSEMIEIEQFGSTRSVNVGVASGIIMYEFARRNTLSQE